MQDESGQIDQGGLFALGGIAVRGSDWPELRRGSQETLAAHGWPLDREIKWHRIRTGPGAWRVGRDPRVWRARARTHRRHSTHD